MNNDFIEPCFCFTGANLIDKIRQKIIDLKNNPSLVEITYFLNESLEYLQNNLPQDVALELYYAVFTLFTEFYKELMPTFDEILEKSRTNANYIYITSLLLSYLIHSDPCLSIPDHQSFINDAISEICQQITNQSELIIFGHNIAPRFQSDLILNTALSSTLTDSISPESLNYLISYIFFHYWQKEDKNFDTFISDIIKSGLNTILPQTKASNEEILDFLSKKDDQIFLKMNPESFSIIKSAIIYIKNESKVQINGLDENTIFQFMTVISVLFQLRSNISPSKQDKFSICSEEKDIVLLRKAANLTKNNDSPFLKYILKNWSLFTSLNFSYLTQSLDFIDILVQQLINNEYKANKFILINLYLNSFNQFKPENSYQLSNLFSFIFSNLKKEDFYNCRNNFIYKSFDLDYVDPNAIMNQFHDLKTEEETIQKIYFLEKVCFNQPFIAQTANVLQILMKIIEQEIESKKFDNTALICHFLRRNNFENEIEKLKEKKNLPLIIKLNLFDVRTNQEDEINNNTEINKLLNNILTNDDLEKFDYLFSNLFELMIKDEDNLYCYLSYLVSHLTLYDVNSYLDYFYNEYNKYHDMFLRVTNELFTCVNNSLVVRNNFKPQNYKISEFGSSIVSKIFASLKENPTCNYQAFLCLKSIACTFPILFNSNIQQVFDSILEPFNNLYLLFENKQKDEKTLLLTKTAYASLSFLLSSFQSSLVLDHFIKWMFTNFESFSNSQIFGFIYILKCLSNVNNAFDSFMPGTYKEYDLFNKIAAILNRKITEGSNFELNYKSNIFDFLNCVLYGIDTMTPYVICQDRMLSQVENKFTYFFSNIFSKYIEYNELQIEVVDENVNQFINSIATQRSFYFTFDLDERKRRRFHLNTEQFRTFYEEIPHFSEIIISDNEINITKPISIRMTKYMVMKPFWIYSTLLFHEHSVYSNEKAELLTETVKKLKELKNQFLENPQDEDDSDVESLNIIDSFSPLICQDEFIKTLIDQLTITKLDKNILYTVFHRMAFYPNVSKKILEFINSKIIEFADDPSYILCFIEFFKLMSFNDNFKNNLFDSCGNNLINIILSPKCRNDSKLILNTATFLKSLKMKLPVRVTHIICFLLLMKTRESILSGIQLCHFYNENELSVVNDLLLDIYDYLLNDLTDKNIFTEILFNAPSVVKARKLDTASLLTKLFEDYSNDNNEETFQIICALLNALAPDRINSTTVSRVIDSSTSIPSFIRETEKDFWDFYEQHIEIINQKLLENPLLLSNELKFLINYPEIVDFKVRSSYFKYLMKKRNYSTEILYFTVDFSNILESSFQCLHDKTPKQFLNAFRVSVVNSPVTDIGGVKRTWFSLLTKELFNPKNGLFDCSNIMKGYKPSCESFVHENHLEYFKFAGMFVARALVEGINIDAHLASSFCKQILHRRISYTDLDERNYKSSKSILEDDANTLYLTFAINVDELGEIKTIELKENGSEIPVTNENKVEFVNLRTNYILYGQIKDQIDAFISGFDSMIPHEYLRIFTHNELDLLICGIPKIDVNDFKANMTYIEPYNENTLVVRLFFEVIQNWGNEDLAKLLLFMTGSSRVPLNGFKEFAEITGHTLKIGPGGTRNLWPQSHTCFNELDLPEYQTKEELERNLRGAIKHSDSFGII